MTRKTSKATGWCLGEGEREREVFPGSREYSSQVMFTYISCASKSGDSQKFIT